MLRVNGLFKILKKIDDNTYQLKLLGDYGVISATFDVPNLSTYVPDQEESSLINLLIWGKIFNNIDSRIVTHISAREIGDWRKGDYIGKWMNRLIK